MNILNRIERSDTLLLMLLNSFLKCKTLDVIMPIITYLGSKFFLSLFCLYTILNHNTYIRLIGTQCIISIILSTTVAQVLKKAINRTRPFLSIDTLNVKKIDIDKYSFPSGHTAAAFSLGIMLSLFYHSIAFIFIILSFLVGISRVYLGVHYPSDILIGSLLGSTFSLLVYFLFS